MNYRCLSLLLLVVPIGLAAMNMSLNNNNSVTPFEIPTSYYPPTFGHISSLKLLTQRTKKVPNALNKKIKRWIEKNDLLLTFILPDPKNHNVTTLEELTQFRNTIKEMVATSNYQNLSEHNYIFRTGTYIIKISGHESRLINRLSSLGHDPYEKMDKTTEQDRIKQALASDIPTYQHTSHVATQLLLQELDSPLVKATPTYLYHVPTKNSAPNTIEDANYIVVQESIGHCGYKQFQYLSLGEKSDFLRNISLEELYRAITFANLWDVSEKNMWVNPETGKIAFPDGEKPNNEGVGESAKRRVAIFGQDLGKYKHNVRYGHRGFETILKLYASELVNRWNKLYETDVRFKQPE